MSDLTDKLRARLAPALGDDEYAIALTEKLLSLVSALEDSLHDDRCAMVVSGLRKECDCHKAALRALEKECGE